MRAKLYFELTFFPGDSLKNLYHISSIKTEGHPFSQKSLFIRWDDPLKMLYFRTVKSMDKAAPHLNNIQELLKNAIFLQQQLKYEQSRKNKRDSGSLYQRFSSHLTSVDLPDLGDIRVDSVIGQACCNDLVSALGVNKEITKAKLMMLLM